VAPEAGKTVQRFRILPLTRICQTNCVSVRSRDVSPSWAGCAGELADTVVLLVRVSAVRFDALVDVSSALYALTRTYAGVSDRSTRGEDS
jgi:hypothetical protein